MGDDVDVDALLEAAYEKKSDDKRDKKDSRSRKDNKHHKSSKSKRSRSRSKERKSKHKDRRSPARRDRRNRSRSRDREREREKRNRSGERRRRDRSREKRRPSRSPPRPKTSASPSRRTRDRSGSPARPARDKSSPLPQLTPEERDARTIFVMQLSQRCRARDIEEFFSSVGKIRDIRLIMCNKTRRFKGIAYVEFQDIESVTLALGLNGQKLLGIPVNVQQSQAEKNRQAPIQERLMSKAEFGPLRLYVGHLHLSVTEDMLKSIFSPFGKVLSLQLLIDEETGRSKGFGFVTFAEAEDAKKAVEQMDGFELAGRPMKVSIYAGQEKNPESINTNAAFHGNLEYEENGKMGFELGASGRLALMAKLAEGTGMKLPQFASQALSNHNVLGGVGQQAVAAYSAAAHKQQQSSGSPVDTQCFMLSNMFDVTKETGDAWETEIRDDVIEECNKHGGVLHIFVDKSSAEGNVFVKCTNVQAAVNSVGALHGRWFAGKVITAAYIPVANYHNLFPDGANAVEPLRTNR